MKYSVFTVVMGEYSMEEAAAELVRLGYDGVEWRVHEDYHIHPERVLENAELVKTITRNLEIPLLGAYQAPQDIKSMEKLFLVADKMGCPAVRLQSVGYTGSVHYDQALKAGIGSLKEVERIAAATGIKALFEIHSGTIIPSASGACRLVSCFDPKCIGVIFDPANMILEGRENWRMGLEILGSYLAHVHVKNIGWFPNATGTKWEWRYTPLDKGMVDWGEVARELKHVGYDGYLSVEDLYGSNTNTSGLIKEQLPAQQQKTVPTLEKLRNDLNYLRSIA